MKLPYQNSPDQVRRKVGPVSNGCIKKCENKIFLLIDWNKKCWRKAVVVTH